MDSGRLGGSHSKQWRTFNLKISKFKPSGSTSSFSSISIKHHLNGFWKSPTWLRGLDGCRRTAKAKIQNSIGVASRSYDQFIDSSNSFSRSHRTYMIQEWESFAFYWDLMSFAGRMCQPPCLQVQLCPNLHFPLFFSAPFREHGQKQASTIRRCHQRWSSNLCWILGYWSCCCPYSSCWRRRYSPFRSSEYLKIKCWKKWQRNRGSLVERSEEGRWSSGGGGEIEERSKRKSGLQCNSRPEGLYLIRGWGCGTLEDQDV